MRRTLTILVLWACASCLTIFHPKSDEPEWFSDDATIGAEAQLIGTFTTGRQSILAKDGIQMIRALLITLGLDNHDPFH